MERKEVKRRKVISQAHFKFDRSRYGERNDGPSETVPNEAMTIRQIFDRFRKGMPLGAQERQGSFTSDGSYQDFDSPDFDKLKDSDFVERDEFQERLMAQIEEKKAQVKKYRAEETQRRQKEDQELQELREELRIRRTKPKDAGSPGEPQSGKSVV